MRDLLLDTNILVFMLRGDTRWDALVRTYNLATTRNFISSVTLGELYSLALCNKWGISRLNQLARLRHEFIVLEIDDDDIVQRYGEIDAYSQGKLASRPLAMTSRNMGKNDIWIAATGSLFGLPLITADQDFAHLNGVYLDVYNV